MVGDKVFLTQEIDELTCIDKKSGKILWRRTNTFFDATPPEERDKSPLFKDAEPVVDALQKCDNYVENLRLHRQLQEILTKIDAKKYVCLGLHGGQSPCVGYAAPNVCSDGKQVYVYLSHGVVACYDLDGNRKWIHLINDVPWGFPNASPALAGDKLIVQRGSVLAFEKTTGKAVWTTPLLDARCGGTVPAKVDGEDVVLVNCDRVLRCSDGKLLSDRKSVHHATPVVTEDHVVVSCGDANLSRWRMQSLTGDVMKIKFLPGCAPGIPNADNIASPLWDNGFVYMMDGKGRLVVWQVSDAAAKVAYSKSLGLDPMHVLWEELEYGCCASPMLGGKHVYLMDNQGTTVVIEPGGVYQQVAVNKIENYLSRRFITNTQEHFYASPVCDGRLLFIRGEETLYCIGKQ